MWRDLLNFVRISRPLNVLISLLAFSLSCFLAQGHALHFLADGPFWGTALTIGLIAATGYWINDVYDFRIDRVNRPGRTIVNALLSVKKVLTIYFIVITGTLAFSLYYLGYRHEQYHISFINIVSVLLLFWYASHLKRVSVVGNLLVSFLSALVLFLALYLYPSGYLAPVWAVLFAFEITLIREITKDIEDIQGDLAFNLHTLPIQIGLTASRRVLTLLYVLFILSCWLPAVVHFARFGAWKTSYLLSSVLLVQLPAAYLLGTLRRAETPAEFRRQSLVLKVLMLTGMLTLLLL